MRPHSSIRQSKKLSEERNTHSSANAYGFNRKRLAKELLSIGNPKISVPIAESISHEVEKELLQKDESLISTNTISELVRFKLEEMGLIEIKPRKEQPRVKQTEKAMKVTHPFVPQATPLRLTLKSAPMQISKETLKWSPEGKKAFERIPEWLKLESASWENPEAFLDQLSRAIAEIDSHFEGFHDIEATSTQFYNRIANLDFIPGSLFFKTDYKSGKFTSAPSSYLAKPEAENVYEIISHFSRNNPSLNTTLGIQIQDKAEQQDANLLLLKLLKTSLEYGTSQNPDPRQELYLSLQDFSHEEKLRANSTDENDHEDLSSPFSSLFQWLEEEENRKYFSLSLGVPGRTSPYLSLPESFEQNLVRILHSHLQVSSSVRLYFLERCLGGMNVPQGQADRVPNPQSPGLQAQDEIVPSLFLNLAVMVKDEEVDWDRLRRAARQALHFLDNVIDFWVYPNPESEKITKSNRSIAIGVMGLSDLLFTLRIPYNSQEALDLAGKMASFIEEEAQKASIELAKTRGVFPNYIGSSWQEKGIALRNAQICSIVWDPLPSLIAQTSIGIEAHNALVALEGFEGERPKYLIHPFLAETARKRGFLNDRVLAKAIELRSLSAVPEVPDDIRKVFVCSGDINLTWHLLMGAAFERHFDNGVVKTCSLPIFSDKSDNLQNILEQARELGLKSLWIKREGDVIHPQRVVEPIFEKIEEEISLEPLLIEENLPLEIAEAAIEEPTIVLDNLEELTQTLPVDLVIETEAKPEEEKTEIVIQESKPSFIRSRERPDLLQGSTQRQSSCCGDIYITLNRDEQGPYEVLAQLPNAFSTESIHLEALCKLVSLCLKCGIDPQEIRQQIQGTLCLKHFNTEKAQSKSPVDLISDILNQLSPKAEESAEKANDIFFDEDKTEVIQTLTH